MFNRSISRVFTLLAATLLVGDFALAVKPDPGSKLETAGKGASPTGAVSLNGTAGAIDPTQYIENLNTRFANNPPPNVRGRESEVQNLDFALDSQNRSRRTALLLGEPSSGRSSLMTEFVLSHPLDTVWRLDLERMSSLSVEDRAIVVKQVLRHVKSLEKNNSGGRTILYIDDMTALTTNAGIADPILDAIAFKTVAPLMVLEIDPDANTKLFKNYKDLYKLVSVIEPKPAAYDAVLTHLYNEQDAIKRQAGGLTISRPAFEEAARLAVRYRGASPFTVADQILRHAALRVYNETSRQQTEAANITRQLNALQVQMSSVLDEIKNGGASGIAAQRLEQTRISLQTRIDQLTSRKGELAAPVMGERQRLVEIQRETEEIKKELQILNADSGILSRNNSRKNELQRRLTELTLEHNDLLADGKELKMEQAGQSGNRLTAKHVQIVAADILNIPVSTLSIDMRQAASQITRLNEEVINQDHIIRAAATDIPTVLARRELREANAQNNPDDTLKNKRGEKPIWSALLGGESGTGKTEFFKQLSELLGMDFKLIPMGEFKEKHSVSRLIGAPPGYVGYDAGGQLTEFVRNHPNSVIVFDEIEKADPEIFDIFLRIGDDGIVTDGQGRDVDFRHAIVGFTTNLGIEYLKMERADLVNAIIHEFSGQANELRNMDMQELRRIALRGVISRAMRPEFANRMNFIGLTNPHNEFSIKFINTKLARTMAKDLAADARIKLVVSESALDLMQNHYTGNGARDLINNFDRFVAAPILNMLNQVQAGDVILVDGSHGGLEFLHGSGAQFNSALANGNALYEKSDLKKTRDALLKQAGAADDASIKAKRLFDDRVMVRDAVIEAFRGMGKR